MVVKFYRVDFTNDYLVQVDDAVQKLNNIIILLITLRFVCLIRAVGECQNYRLVNVMLEIFGTSVTFKLNCPFESPLQAELINN